MTELLDKAITALYSAFDEDRRFKYANRLEESDYYEIIKNKILEQAKDPYPIDGVYFSWLMDLSLLHFEYSCFSFVKRKDLRSSGRHLELSNEYGYACLHYGALSCGCFEEKNPFVIMNKAAFMMCNLLLHGNNKKFNEVGLDLIGSLNGENCIIKRGYRKGNISWFLIKLYSLHTGNSITLNSLLQPNLSDLYARALDSWDTEDLGLVEKYAIMLCNAHLSQASVDYAIHSKKDVGSLRYIELFAPHMYANPFEILYWFKLRSLHDLANPVVDHPLMKGPLEGIYDIRTPKMSQDIPFVNMLLKRISNACDDFREYKLKE